MNNLIFFDVDGTLIKEPDITNVTSEFRKGLKKIRENGDKYFICTGRAHGFLPEVIQKLDADGYSLCAGSFVTIDGQVLRNAHFTEDIVKFITNRFNQFDIVYYLEAGFEIYCNNPYDGRAEAYLTKFLINPKVIKKLESIEGLKVNKISVTLEDPEQISCMDDFSEKGITVLTQPDKISYDITLSSSTKRDGLRTIKNYYSSDNKYKTYAFGDGYNDIEMIEYADVGVAMGNGPKDLKEKADFVTKTVMEDGVTYALKELKLI